MKRLLAFALLCVLSISSYAAKAHSGILPGKGRTFGITIGAAGKTTTVSRGDYRNMAAQLPSNLGFTPAAKLGLTINPTFGLGLGIRTGLFAEYSRSTYNDKETSVWQNILNNTDISTILPNKWIPDLGDNTLNTIYRDISVQVPLQLSFRIMPLPKFGVVFYVGPTAEVGVWQVKYTTNENNETTITENLYKDNFKNENGSFDAWNIMMGGGVGMEMGRCRLDVSTDWGVRKMANSLYWNKPLSANLTVFF